MATPTAAPAAALVAVWEGQITLTTYGWDQALAPTAPGDSVYPYPRMDFDAVGPPALRTYRAVYIQNDFVQLVVLPELGGRLYRWVDRISGRQLFYANPVVKPTRWGARGWWLATGGMEWAFPVDEHGLNEYRPWQYELLRNGVRVWDTDDRTGLMVEVTIALEGDRSTFAVAPRISNGTGEPQRYQFWANAMLTLSDSNAPTPLLRFILPTDLVVVHSSSDPSLPQAGASMAWPVYNGRDFSRYSEWQKPTGVFAGALHGGYVGAYDPSVDQGVVRIFPANDVRGVKVFCLGDLGAELWTDGVSRYFELWGGITPSFWDYRTLDAGGAVAWTEHWYPVTGIGGFDWANGEAAIRLTPIDDHAEVGVVSTRPRDATIRTLRGGAEVQRWEARIGPGQPFLAATDPTSIDGEWTVQVLENGSIVAQVGP